MKKTIKNKLIGKGSFGCIFKPNLECKSTNLKEYKKKNKTNKISKVIINNNTNEIDHEYMINKLISKIPNHKDWTVLWDDKCEPLDYSLIKNTSEIKKCLQKSTKSINEYNQYAQMLIGDYGGLPFKKYCETIINKSTFTSYKNFTHTFIKLFKLLNNLFIGLFELQKINVVHQDLSINNILIKDNKLYIIDFGLSSKFKDDKFIYKRSKKQILGSRIYDPYPYEYVYMYANNKERKKEINKIKTKNYRNNHDDFLLIHKNIFNRNNIHKIMINNLIHKQLDKKSIIKKLDTYSLGMLILNIFCNFSYLYNIPKKKLLKCFKIIDIQNHISLLKEMTEYNSNERIDIFTAYERFKSLI